MLVRLFFVLAVPWGLFLGVLPVSAQTSVHFKAHIEVSGPKIVLSDIAIIRPAGPETEGLAQLPVAAAPALGKSKELHVVTVINSLRNRPEAADVDWQGSPTVLVERKGTTLPPERMQRMIEAFLQENSTILPKAEIRFVQVRPPEGVTLPPGNVTWKITPSRPGIIGSTSFTIALFSDGQPAGNCTVRGRLEVMADVLIATTVLHKGDTVTETNVAVQRQDVSGVNNPLVNLEEILGKQVARTVTAGTILKPENIVLPAVIKEGEMVKIRAHKGSMQISTSGLAKTNGRIGETIAVKNISSNKMIRCRVDGPGSVSVEF